MHSLEKKLIKHEEKVMLRHICHSTYIDSIVFCLFSLKLVNTAAVVMHWQIIVSFCKWELQCVNNGKFVPLDARHEAICQRVKSWIFFPFRGILKPCG